MKVLIQCSDGVFKEHELEVLRMNVLGIATHYRQGVYIDELDSWDFIDVAYDKPKIRLDFLAKVDVKLNIMNAYFDGKNQFLAVSEHEIRNLHGELDNFEIPKTLVNIYTAIVD